MLEIMPMIITTLMAGETPEQDIAGLVRINLGMYDLPRLCRSMSNIHRSCSEVDRRS